MFPPGAQPTSPYSLPVRSGYYPAPIMGNGRGGLTVVRFGLLAGIVIPLVLLVGAPASAWHTEHSHERECAVCHSGHQTANLSRPVEFASTHVPERIEQVREVRRAVSLRHLLRPARAPPA